MTEKTTGKPVRSYGRVRGRKLRPVKQGLVNVLLPRIAFSADALTQYSEWWLEIGAGGGEHAAYQAERNPVVGYLACEPYVNGLAHLLQAIHEKKLQNIRLFSSDVRDLLPQLPQASIARAFILFPDPWPKARHHKRRLIQPAFLEALARVMQPGARLRIATDHVDYLGWILSHMLASPHFQWQATRHTNWSEMPEDAIITRYQAKAAKEGRVATYLEFVKVS